jgi:RecA-family ATPase
MNSNKFSVMQGITANNNFPIQQLVAPAAAPAAITLQSVLSQSEKVERGNFYLLDMPEPFKHEPEIIRNLIPQKTVGFLSGGSGAGKSFLAIEFAVSITTGSDFVGHKVEQQGGVIIVATEGQHTLNDRMIAKRSTMSNPSIALPIEVIEGVAPILTKDDRDNFQQKIEGAMSALKSQYDVNTVLVIIDIVCAASMIAADKENDPGSWASVFAHMNNLVRAKGFTAVLVHHYGKSADARLRGSSNTRASADFVMALTCDHNETTGDAKNRVLAITKSRSGREGPISRVELKEVEIV